MPGVLCLLLQVACLVPGLVAGNAKGTPLPSPSPLPAPGSCSPGIDGKATGSSSLLQNSYRRKPGPVLLRDSEAVFEASKVAGVHAEEQARPAGMQPGRDQAKAHRPPAPPAASSTLAINKGAAHEAMPRPNRTLSQSSASAPNASLMDVVGERAQQVGRSMAGLGTRGFNRSDELLVFSLLLVVGILCCVGWLLWRVSDRCSVHSDLHHTTAAQAAEYPSFLKNTVVHGVQRCRTSSFSGMMSGGDSGKTIFLCPSLVVPVGEVCEFRVPRLPALSAEQPRAEIHVTDPEGNVVFLANLTSGDRGMDAVALTIQDCGAGSVFASCRPWEGKRGDPAGLAIRDQSGGFFGCLQPSKPGAPYGYTVSSSSGWLAHLSGTVQGEKLNVSDDLGRMLAKVEPIGPQRRVSIGPKVDAGLIVLCILGIDIMECYPTRRWPL